MTTNSTTTLELPAPAPVRCSDLLAEVWVVNKTVSWEREIMGIYTDKAQADAHLDTLGPSAYITKHKLNEPGSGHFC